MQLIHQFSSPLPVHRTNAQRELLKRGADGKKALLQALSEGQTDEQTETWCLWTLGLMPSEEGVHESYFRQQLTAAQSSLNRRIQVVRILADQRHRRGGDQTLPPEVIELLQSGEARLRLAAVLAIREVCDRSAVAQLVKLAAQEQDRVVAYCIWQTMRQVLGESDLQGLLLAEASQVRRAAFLALAEDGRMTEAVAQRLAATEPVAQLWLQRMSGGTAEMVVRGRPLNATGASAVSGQPSDSQSSVVSLLDGVSSRGGGEYRVATVGLRAGVTIFTDRAYQFRSIPAGFEGAEYVQTANNDDGSTGADFLTLQAIVPVVVTVGWDQRNSSLPDWLQKGFREKIGRAHV